MRRNRQTVACLAKSKLRDNVIATYIYLEDRYKDDGAQLFSAVPDDVSRGSGHELQIQEVQVELEGKINHSRKVVQHRGMVETPLLNVLKIQLGKTATHLI